MRQASAPADGLSSHVRVLKAHFSALTSLSETETDLLDDLAEAARYHPPYRDLYAVGAPALQPRIIVAGWACQYRLLPDGHRQIVSVRLPGDLTGSLTQFRLPASCAVAALTELETVSAQVLIEMASTAIPAYPGLAHAAHVMAYLDNIMLHDQIVRLGRQTACSRFAHLMLGFYERLSRVGLASNNCFTMPLTQDVLADVLGFSAVHVNRTVQQLRREGLLDVRSGVAILTQPERLRTLANWEPSSWPNYLSEATLHQKFRGEQPRQGHTGHFDPNTH